MTKDELEILFNGDGSDEDGPHEGEFLKFDRVENKRSQRRDLHAFLMLEELVPCNRPIVAAADHEEIYLDVDPEALSAVITEAQVVELIRCGVRYSEDGLCMFV